MFLIYSFIIRSYGLILYCLSPFHLKAKQLHTGRTSQLAELKSAVSGWQSGKAIWIHAASYGEYEMARPIVRELLKEGQDQIIISFHSPSGYTQAKLEDPRMVKIYLPLDTYGKQAEIVDIIQPNKVLFIKYEFWFNLLRVLRDQKVDYYYSSLHLNPDSYLFSWIMKPLYRYIKESTHIFCHNKNSLEILNDNGVTSCSVIGDTRITQSLKNKEIWRENVAWNMDYNHVIALGSMTKKELPYIIDLVESLTSTAFIIAPHDPETDTELIISKITEPVSYYSDKHRQDSRILILDTMGDLRYIYGYASLAYVGAGFEKGPHNVLEPLVYGIPIFTGPNISKFPMAQLLQKEGLLHVIPRIEELSDTIVKKSQIVDYELFRKRTNEFFQETKDSMSHLITSLTN